MCICPVCHSFVSTTGLTINIHYPLDIYPCAGSRKEVDFVMSKEEAFRETYQVHKYETSVNSNN